MEEGIVDRYSEDKGYGFIKQDDGQEVRVERDSIDVPGYKSLNPGDRVAFEVEETPVGAQARNVKKL